MEYYERPTLNYFTTRALDRLEEKRSDEAWIAARLQDESTRFIPVWRDKNLFAKGNADPIFLSPADVRKLLPTAESVILLGVQQGVTHFAIGLSAEAAPPTDLTELGRFRSLRGAAALLAEQDCALLTYAKGMAYWHHHQRFCGVCGSPTKSAAGGSIQICTDTGCGQQHFPSIGPAIIVLVTLDNRCLLGRKPDWPQGSYSTIAGFVEPAESLEAAVIREVREETGVEVASMRYFGSQPWPFPNSLMLGFTAQAASENIRVDQDEAQRELEDARWFTREEIREGLAQGTLRLSLKLAISFHLIEHWFDRADCGPLREISPD